MLLLVPSWLDFVEWAFGCWYAGATIVPLPLPRHSRAKHRLDAVFDHSGATLGVGPADVLERLGGTDVAASRLTWFDAGGGAPAAAVTPPPAGPHPALLQYTSGSTGTPRGVCVSHANLIHNTMTTARACGHDRGSVIGGWLPLFHDMGLIGLILQAAFTGGRCVFMPPERFLMRPWSWLKMISDYDTRTSPAPNFAYDLCVEKTTDTNKVGLALGGWRNALNGSEPVRPATLDRFAAAFASCGFAREAFFPCYGLAESTLFVTGPGAARRPARRTAGGIELPHDAVDGHVGCGGASGGTRVLVVDPHTRRPVAGTTVGEIWVSGPSVAGGYWNDPQATAATFDARLADDPVTPWLRTGDLCFVADGDLFPVDLERTAESAHAAVTAGGVAAFSADVTGVERIIVTAEIKRDVARGALDGDAVRRAVRAAVAAGHDVAPHDVVLLSPGGLPKTTSGKISRSATRAAYAGGTLDVWKGDRDERRCA